MSTAFAADQPSFAVRSQGGALVSSGGGVSAVFVRSGPRVAAAGSSEALRLTGVGSGRRLVAPLSASAVARKNVASYDRGFVTESYSSGPRGLEQSFTLAHRPAMAPAGQLTLRIGFSGSLVARQAGTTIVFARSSTGPALLRYGALSAHDATGRTLPVQLVLHGNTLLLRVNDRGARYPLTIDPLIQQGPKLVDSTADSNASFGYSVALSSDGNTALIGGYGDSGGVGAAWVFTRSGSTWTQQQELVDSPTDSYAYFGDSVALSSDGNTALIGGAGDSSAVGAAWVFAAPSTTNTTAASSVNPSPTGAPVTYTATVNPAPDGGTLAFADNGVTISGCGTVGVDTSSGTATCHVTYTAAGSHPITAGYSGDSNYSGSTSATLTQTVTAAPAAGSTGSSGSPPSSAFTITSDTGSSIGTITLGVNLPGPGRVDVLGTHVGVVGGTASALEPGYHRFAWGRRTVNATSAGDMTITLKPDTNGKKLLVRHHHHGWATNVRVWLTYTPTAGYPRTKEVNVRLFKAKQH